MNKQHYHIIATYCLTFVHNLLLLAFSCIKCISMEPVLQSVPQPPASQAGVTSGSRAPVSRLSEPVPAQTKIPRLADSAGTSSHLTAVPQRYDKPLASRCTTY